jgi:hypothetical protein
MIKIRKLLCMALLCPPAYAVNIDNGESLHQETCLECHSPRVEDGDHSTLYTRENRRVKDFAGLESMVRMCDSNLKIGWFDDEIMDVVAYLNQTYYHFPQPKVVEPTEKPQK